MSSIPISSRDSRDSRDSGATPTGTRARKGLLSIEGLLNIERLLSIERLLGIERSQTSGVAKIVTRLGSEQLDQRGVDILGLQDLPLL